MIFINILKYLYSILFVSYAKCSSSSYKYPAKVSVREGRSIEDGYLVQIEAIGKTRNLHVTLMENIWSDNSQAVFLSLGENGEEIYERKNIPKDINIYHNATFGSILSVKHGIVHGILDSKNSIMCEDGNHFIIKAKMDENMYNLDDDYKLINDYVRKPKEISQKDYNRKAKTFKLEIATIVSNRLADGIGNDTQIYQYLAIYWNAVKRRFKSIRNPRINIRLVGSFIFRNLSHETFYRKFSANSDLYYLPKTIEMLSFWIYSNLDYLPDHDIMVLLSTYMLYRIENVSSTTIIGHAIMEGACKIKNDATKQSLSLAYVLEHYPYFFNTDTAAHEIGHSLGATHDSKTKNVEGCNFIDGYIMSYHVDSRKSKFFSWCSICQMAKYISSKDASCLTKPINQTKPPGVYKSKILPGQLFTMSQQCQRFQVNSNSTVYTNVLSEDMLCINLYCTVPDNDTIPFLEYNFGAAEGSECPSGGRCKDGRCL